MGNVSEKILGADCHLVRAKGPLIVRVERDVAFPGGNRPGQLELLVDVLPVRRLRARDLIGEPLVRPVDTTSTPLESNTSISMVNGHDAEILSVNDAPFAEEASDEPVTAVYTGRTEITGPLVSNTPVWEYP